MKTAPLQNIVVMKPFLYAFRGIRKLNGMYISRLSGIPEMLSGGPAAVDSVPEEC